MQIKKLLRKILFLSILIIGVYALWYHSVNNAPTNFQIKQITYNHQEIPTGFDDFKIGFISDFDLKTSEDVDYLEKCINQLNQQNLDMIIFGGDLFEGGKIFDEDRVISLLKSIDAPNGRLAVLGENDFQDNLEASIALLEKGGFEVMRSKAHNIYHSGHVITFSGMETSGDVDSTLTDSQKSGFVITAIHQPDYFTDILNTSADLVLAGHSGGGFIHLPLIGSMVKYEGSNTYNYGHYNVDGKDLYISNGLGMGHEQTARFNCSPNALVITLKHSNPEIQNDTPAA